MRTYIEQRELWYDQAQRAHWEWDPAGPRVERVRSLELTCIDGVWQRP